MSLPSLCPCGRTPGTPCPYDDCPWPTAEGYCTPRCVAGLLHALDCPSYTGPLSPSHSLTEPPTGADVARDGEW